MARRIKTEDAPLRLPNGETVTALMRQYRTCKGEMDKHRAELGPLIKNAENDHGVHPKAFKLVEQLQRMDATRMSAFLAHFDHYRQICGLDAQEELDLAPAPTKAATKSEKAPKATKAKGPAKSDPIAKPIAAPAAKPKPAARVPTGGPVGAAAAAAAKADEMIGSRPWPDQVGAPAVVN
jgi:hypothetical protein